jgi:hypothetical protein
VRPAGKKTAQPAARDAAADYRAKAAHEISRISRRMKEVGHPTPLGDPTSGVVLVVEQPVGPRVLEALDASLHTIGLPDAYVTYASTGLLGEEILSTQPRVLVAVGPGAARDLDDLDHPLARKNFSEADPGSPFAWTRGATGLLLPALAPALDDEPRKRRFWTCFLVLKDLAA